jgi:hypothetical protein
MGHWQCLLAGGDGGRRSPEHRAITTGMLFFSLVMLVV